MSSEQIVEGPDLLPWQSIVYNAIRNEASKYYTVVSSRQLGKSTLASVLILDWAINNPYSSICVCSITYRQVKQIFNSVESVLSQTSIFVSSSKTTMEIELSNGSKILFFSIQNPDAIRGFTFTHAILDEMAFYSTDIFAKVIQPTLIVRGEKVVAFSTPRGENNSFYELYKLGLDDDNPMYQSFSFDYTHNPLLDPSEIEQIRKTIPDEIFKQEYECYFVDGASVFKNLGNVCVLQNFKESPSQNVNYYMGVDTAINSDWSVATIVNQDNEVQFIYRERTGSVKKLEEDLIALIKKFKPLKVTVESNNIGQAIIETLWQHFPSSQIIPFTTTNSTKVDIIHELIKSFENMEIKLPTRQLYPTMYQELMDFTFKYSNATKALQYQARPGMHDDCVMSLALTNHTWRKHNIPKRKMGQLAHRFVR